MTMLDNTQSAMLRQTQHMAGGLCGRSWFFYRIMRSRASVSNTINEIALIDCIIFLFGIIFHPKDFCNNPLLQCTLPAFLYIRQKDKCKHQVSEELFVCVDED